MELRRYLIIAKLSPVEFAKQIGVSEPGIRKWLRGERVPRPGTMAAITKATGGAVTANDFVAKVNGHRKRRRS